VLGWRDIDPRGRSSLPLPSYEATFRTVSIHVRLDRRLSGDAAADAAAIMAGIRGGHLYTALDGLAAPPAFEFTAENTRGVAREGDRLPDGGPVTLRVRSNAGQGFVTTIWRDGHLVKTSQRGVLTLSAGEGAASYTVEIRTERRDRAPWLASNPIYLGQSFFERTEPASPAPVETLPIREDGTTGRWQIEADPSSAGSVDLGRGSAGRELKLRYTLSRSGALDSYVALMVEIPGSLASSDRLAFTARADRPTRISAQFRTGATHLPQERWRRSVYLDQTDRERTVRFADLTPIDAARASAPPLANLRYLLFVIDRTNSTAGSSGTIWIRGVRLER
jgi:hypothetical protein